MRRLMIVVMVPIVFSCGGEAPTAPSDIPVVDLPYESIGFSPGLVLDLYLPDGGDGPFPAVVYIHGGGWNSGSRGQFRPQATHMASKGFVGASIDYRLAPGQRFPAALHDAKAAVRWLRANASTYNIDPSRIGAAGGSAGGHLAALLGTTQGIAGFEGGANPGFSSAVQAVAAFDSVLDLVSLAGSSANFEIEQFLGVSFADDPDLWAHASPISHVTGGSAPFLFLHGTADTSIPYSQSVDMMNALLAVGVPAEIFRAEGATHAFFQNPPWYQPTLEAMENFFVRMLR